MIKYIKLFEAFDTHLINAALGFIENNGDNIVKKYGDKSFRVAKAILVDLRDNGDKGRDYSGVPELGKADEVYKKALDLASKIQTSDPQQFGQLSSIGNGITIHFERTINGKKYIIGTKPEE